MSMKLNEGKEDNDRADEVGFQHFVLLFGKDGLNSWVSKC